MLDKLCNALAEAIGIPFAKFAWSTAPTGDYGVIAVDGEGATLYADDELVCQACKGVLEVYCAGDGEQLMLATQAAMTANDDVVTWRFYDSDYDDETRMTHYIWFIEVFLYG